MDYELEACPTVTSSLAAAPRYKMRPSLDGLPQELIELMGLHLCRQTPVGPPVSLLPLMVLNTRFYDIFGPNNHGFYADLFKERFDWVSVKRRWETMKKIEDKREKRVLLNQVLVNTTTKIPNEDLILNPAGSFTRSNSPNGSLSDLLPVSTSTWRPLTSKDLAVEFKRRCTILTKMRRASLSGVIPPSSSRPNSPRPGSPRLAPMTPTESFKLPIAEPDELTQNLWTCYLMLLENDGNNVNHLMDYGLLKTYMRLFYKHSLLSEALRPGWPRQSAGRALGLWIGWLGGDDFNSETSTESDERFFVLKPYVFGAHKFDAFHVPWTIRSLPVNPSSHPIFAPAPSDPFLADLRPRTQAQQIIHMGRPLQMAPPILSHAAIFSFFFRVERDPSNSNDLITNTLMGNPLQQATLFNTPAAAGTGTSTGKPAKTSVPTLASPLHDNDFARLVSCVDPYSSLGLPPLFAKGSIEGSWEGRFSFFDFDSYREMLGGRMRSLYEGPFGDQPQVWKLEEKIVRINRLAGEKIGGKGPIGNAGFEIGQQGPRASFSPLTSNSGLSTAAASAVASSSSASTAGAPLSRSRSSGRRKSIDMDTDEVAFMRGGGTDEEGKGRASKRARSKEESLFENDWDEEEEIDDADYEILLTGFGHSAWGQFRLKGRIRSYDGLFSITKEYTPDSRGRWLYRGYCIGGNLVGRWRDTHTPVDMSGYEGTFLMSRRA